MGVSAAGMHAGSYLSLDNFSMQVLTGAVRLTKMRMGLSFNFPALISLICICWLTRKKRAVEAKGERLLTSWIKEVCWYVCITSHYISIVCLDMTKVPRIVRQNKNYI